MTEEDEPTAEEPVEATVVEATEEAVGRVRGDPRRGRRPKRVAEEAAEEETTTVEEALPEGAVAAPDDGSIPEGYEIKGNANSMKYHAPGGRYYDVTIADVFFDTAEHAEAAGYDAPAADTEQDDN